MCYRCIDGQFMNQETHSCSSCHERCATCSGSTATDCTACKSPAFLYGSRCVPCCSSDGPQRSPPDCCHCASPNGPCFENEKTRSILEKYIGDTFSEEHMVNTFMQKPLVVIATICISAVLLFSLIFGLLQFSSARCGRNRYNFRNEYRKVSNGLPAAKYDSSMEKISLDDDADEEDSLFEKT